ncbi:MAG: hypothetical protein HY290_03885 [Planctomycetia bacterium]|nr:hypothetical protein [Planctomycetia bacterium]
MQPLRKTSWLLIALYALPIGGAAYFAWSRHVEHQAHLAARAALLAAEPWRLSPKWCGTRVYSEISVPPTVQALFESDPPVPENRTAVFQRSPSYFGRERLIQWYASIDRVKSNADGWEAIVTVNPRFQGTAFTTAHTVETWQVSKVGDARCLKCESYDGLLIVD